MKTHFHLKKSLAPRALFLAIVNVGSVLVLGLLVMGAANHRDLLDLVQAPIRDRILATSRKIALDLLENDTESWNELLAREAEGTPFTFILLDSEGIQIAGRPATLPGPVMEFVRNGKTELSHSPKYNELDRPDRQYIRGNLLLQRDPDTHIYWAGAHVLIHYMDQDMYGHGTLIWQFPRLWTNPYFFNLWPYVFLLGGSLLLTTFCWLPAVGLILRRVSRLTRATREIAKGNFDASLPPVTDDEIGQLTESIASMSRQISSLLNQQQRFVSDAAHELGSPISRLQFALELMQSECADGANTPARRPQLRRRLQDLSEEVYQITELVEDLLYYSQARSGNLPLQPVRLQVEPLVRSILAKEGLADGPIAVDISRDLELYMPERQMRRSIGNLLRNAQKHAHGQVVEIVGYSEAGKVHLLVRDQGPGIPESELDQVFAPFYRVEYARSRNTGGAGLGLAIVKSSVEACGGTVSCRNRKPQGLEVEITLPNLAPA